MAATTVGVRELAADLDAYLRQVREGSTVVITENGREVGRLVPPQAPLAERLQSLAKSGFASWSGQRFAPQRPQIRPSGDLTVAAMLVEDRE